MANNRWNEGLIDYLTPEAKLALNGFLQAGMDQDLAVAVVEHILPEHKIWDLPHAEDDHTRHVDTD